MPLPGAGVPPPPRPEERDLAGVAAALKDEDKHKLQRAWTIFELREKDR